MKHEDGRVTILPEQVRRLAELSEEGSGAIEIVQRGSVLHFYNGITKLSVNAHGGYIHNDNQEQLC